MSQTAKGWQAIFATLSPGPGLGFVSGLAVSAVFAMPLQSASPDLAIDLAAVALAVH